MSYVAFLDHYGLRFAEAAGVTAALAVCAALIAVVLAFALGMMRLSPLWAVNGIAIVYIEIFRGTSLLVQLYWVFFVLPFFGVTLENFTAGCLAIGMNVAAYGAEVVRGAVLAVPKGQWEAAEALNMTSFQRMRRIILPQALVAMLPAWGNLMIDILKSTALVALIGVAEVMFVAKQINGRTFLSAEAFGTALLFYYIMARFVLTPTMRRLEQRAARRMGRS